MPPLPVKLARYLRVTPGSPAHAQAAPVWAEALRLADPRTWSQRMDLTEFIKAFAPHAAASRDLSRTLEGVTHVQLMAVTIGGALEERAAALFSGGEPFAGYMLDRMGSYLAEAAMRALHASTRLEREAQGGRATRRYSPGYGDFTLEAQAAFVRLSAHALPGLGLTASHMLLPQKSVTAVCGLI